LCGGLVIIRQEPIHGSAILGHLERHPMAQPSKRPPDQAEAPLPSLARLSEQTQLDFELGFFSGIIEHHDGYVDVLRAHGNNLTLKGRYADGLDIDKRLIQLRPTDALAHYNLACSYALLKKPDLALKTLRRAVELGYRDFRYMREDRDLESVRHDPRFRQLLREYESR
jgi:tetratricopeptide (TPR) repeat protein